MNDIFKIIPTNSKGEQVDNSTITEDCNVAFDAIGRGWRVQIIFGVCWAEAKAEIFAA